jgi:hypothetical protein
MTPKELDAIRARIERDAQGLAPGYTPIERLLIDRLAVALRVRPGRLLD